VQYKEPYSPRKKWSITSWTFQSNRGQTKVRNLSHLRLPYLYPRLSLKNDQRVSKWHPRYRTWFYQWNSPRHTRFVSFVLQLETARVSPQFHVQHDKFFETIFCHDKHQPWKMVSDFLNETPRCIQKLQRPITRQHTCKKPRWQLWLSFFGPFTPCG